MLSAVTRRGSGGRILFQPAAAGHVYAAVRQENHAFFLQQCALYAIAAKGKAAAQAAVFKYHAVARDAARLGAAVHREADAPRAALWPRLAAQGLRQDGPVMELYHIDAHDTARVDEYLTEVQVRVARAGQKGSGEHGV